MKLASVLLLFFLTMGGASSAAEFYISANGKPDAAGSIDSPWDIGSALAGERNVAPGDTIWIRGGTYRTTERDLTAAFRVALAGEKDKPIRVRACAGERVTLDGRLNVTSPSAYLWISDLEILVTENLRAERISNASGSEPTDFNCPLGGLTVSGANHCKFINLLIHDNGVGASLGEDAVDCELCGCIIYRNGWIGADRWHGPGIYAQNKDGVKLVTDNILFGNYSHAIQANGSQTLHAQNFVIDGNIIFAPRAQANETNVLVGGILPSRNIIVTNNILHGGCDLKLGIGARRSVDCLVRGNTILRGRTSISGFAQVTDRDNVVWNQGDPIPPNPVVLIRPNKYDPNRANLAIVNLARAKSVGVDASTFLKNDEGFRIVSALDYYGEPVAEGIYNGAPVSITMPSSVETTDGEFCAFVILKEPPKPAVFGDEPRMRVMEMPDMSGVSVTLHDWEQDFTVNPDTGYKSGHEGMTLAPIIKCVVCGRESPAPPIAVGSTPEQKLQVLKAYKCPFCGHDACLIADSAQPR